MHAPGPAYGPASARSRVRICERWRTRQHSLGAGRPQLHGDAVPYRKPQCGFPRAKASIKASALARSRGRIWWGFAPLALEPSAYGVMPW